MFTRVPVICKPDKIKNFYLLIYWHIRYCSFYPSGPAFLCWRMLSECFLENLWNRFKLVSLGNLTSWTFKFSLAELSTNGSLTSLHKALSSSVVTQSLVGLIRRLGFVADSRKFTSGRPYKRILIRRQSYWNRSPLVSKRSVHYENYHNYQRWNKLQIYWLYCASLVVVNHSPLDRLYRRVSFYAE